jgi:glycolate oxidase iron-sulfur subunit
VATGHGSTARSVLDQKGRTVVAGTTRLEPEGSGSRAPGPTDEDLSKCVHCGLCLNVCPTYRATGLETESPRGRIYLMRALQDGRIDLDDSFHTHMDLCLVCRACETACPSGVPFGRMMEATRAQLWKEPVGPPSQRFANRLTFEFLFPHRRIFRALFRPLRAYQKSGLQTVIRRSGLLRRLPGKWGEREALMPALDSTSFDIQHTVSLRIPGTRRVGFLAGCVMSTAFGDVQRASVRVLERFGCQVVNPPGQGCCGALNVHAGERKRAKSMARAVIETMLDADVDAIVVNSAGCGSTMKEYSELFADEPEYLPRVLQFEDLVRDFSEYLAELPFPDSHGHASGVLSGITAVYQDACHLRHAQRITSQPRDLLQHIGGLQTVELAYPDLCCGSAGVYNLQHPEMSNAILDSKMDDIRASGASLVISANPGCILQLRKGVAEAHLPIRVRHIAEVLDEALGSRVE